MPDIIQLLPDHVANQIAAGEVVQRPASVVKELLENAIDASAGSVKLIIKDAGKILIQVIDDGLGMSATDARLSFERHATSKIKKAEDLFNLHTKGFRGEALASIAAVAHVELKTKQENQEVGTLLKIEGSKVIAQEATATNKGTSVAVKNLFYNIPARRNFLKSNTVETRHIVNEFQRIALAHPAIAFSFFHNDSEMYNLPKQNFRQRIVAIFGKKTNEKLVPINEKTEVLEVNGFIAKPEFAKKNRGEQFFFVNNRFIKNAYLHHAIASAFDGLISKDFTPGYFLFLKVPANSIDINIHPTKTEIKFEDERTIYAILRAAIKHSLGQYNVAPVLDFDKNPMLDTPYAYKNKSANVPGITVNPNFNPFKKSTDKSVQLPFKKDASFQQNNLHNALDLYNIEVTPEIVPNTLFNEEQVGGKTFQIHLKYIVSSIKSGIVYIHQNLAHQRILYEEFLENITVKEALSQQLLFPVEISFEIADIELIKNLKEDLNNIGFVFDKILNNSVVVTGMPINITESQITSILENLLNDIKNDIPNTSFSQLDIMAKSLAKSLAIKTGTKLNLKEQEELVNKLFLCKQPEVTPFGKPTFITVTLDEIEKKFTLK
jgi:DNA mismatch repair protein MutL